MEGLRTFLFSQTIIRDTLRLKKTQTKAYHPMGNGMVERF